VRHWNRLPSKACGYPLPGSIPDQAGWGCEQPGLDGGVPACSRGLELHDLKDPFQPKPFNNSIPKEKKIPAGVWAACLSVAFESLQFLLCSCSPLLPYLNSGLSCIFCSTIFGFLLHGCVAIRDGSAYILWLNYCSAAGCIPLPFLWITKVAGMKGNK